ncbi:hypothetical protein [Microbulbifer sp. THAF38]|uniref:hypothetical protein n=1 Tax=Microbulbifer sp. THAF38 TaxID=2587856 RepID=UPI0012681619|nr:hypothetical protein [Microbulbifer sp. THAF38]QFT56586.1 hypothetical protein FIU95_18725 [Microbulbifer sp. THAF38]
MKTVKTGKKNAALKDPNNQGASERLHQLLTRNGYPEGRGRLSRFCKEFGVGKTTAAAWLNNDVLPRDRAEQQRIASALGSNVGYWATGEEGRDLQQVDFLLVGKCVNAIVVYLRDECELDPDTLPDIVLADAYGTLYRYAQENNGDISPELVAKVSVQVLAKLAQKN